MGSGEAMLHIVLIDEDWDCSVTLRIFMADEAATKTGEFIEKAVQTSCVSPHLWRLVVQVFLLLWRFVLLVVARAVLIVVSVPFRSLLFF